MYTFVVYLSTYIAKIISKSNFVIFKNFSVANICVLAFRSLRPFKWTITNHFFTGALDRIRREVALQREKSNSMCRLQTAHNWAEEKERIDYDDPHISFFWKAHTASVLIFLILGLIYVGLIEDPNTHDSEFNR